MARTDQPVLVVCGEALWDFFLGGAPANDLPDLAFDARAGGSPFNVARALARLGSTVSLFSGISNDFLGERLEAILAADGVATHHLVHKEAPTTIALVTVDAQGAARYAFHGHGAADRSLGSGDLPKDLGDAAGLHFGSYSIVAPPTADAFAELAIREAGKRLISLDPNVRPAVEPDLEIWRQRTARLGAHADIVKASTEDLALLYSGAEPADVAKRWLENGTAMVAVTRGAEGADIWNRVAHASIPSPKVRIADTVGAGDSFQAALLHGIAARGIRERRTIAKLTEEELRELGRFATSAAALTCTRPGADTPRLAEVEAFVFGATS